MNQLFGTFARLHREWSEARESPVWQAGRIERLCDELVEVRRQLTDFHMIDEQTVDSLPGLPR